MKKLVIVLLSIISITTFYSYARCCDDDFLLGTIIGTLGYAYISNNYIHHRHHRHYRYYQQNNYYYPQQQNNYYYPQGLTRPPYCYVQYGTIYCY